MRTSNRERNERQAGYIRIPSRCLPEITVENSSYLERKKKKHENAREQRFQKHKKNEDGRTDELKHGQINGQMDRRIARQMSIQTFPPDSRAENRVNYKKIPHLSNHPKRGLPYGWYHSRHSQRQSGSSFSSPGPKLQGELCWQPNDVAFLCKGSAAWKKRKIHLHVLPVGRVYSGSIAVTPQDNRRGQDVEDGVKLGEGDTALVFSGVNKAWLWRHKTQMPGIWVSDLRAKRLHIITMEALIILTVGPGNLQPRPLDTPDWWKDHGSSSLCTAPTDWESTLHAAEGLTPWALAPSTLEIRGVRTLF